MMDRFLSLGQVTALLGYVQGEPARRPDAEATRQPVGLMPGVAAQVVRAKANGWIVSAEWSKISGWWQGAGPFVTRG